MSKIIPVNITTTEQAVTLDATYQFVWLRNMGENDCLLSDHSGIVAGGDDVMTVKAGESGRISTSGRAVYIKTVDGTSTGEIHAQNFSDAPFKCKAKGGGQSISVEPLTVTDNGVYTAPTGKAYSPVTVDVQEQPWQPLQDGYSNFWFELTNDTLSPLLNFSAKTENAVIDWGDGSGEQALTTLTPTHTYAKAGKYVVKCKGVTSIDRQNVTPTGRYQTVLTAVELNTEVTSLKASAFSLCVGLKYVVMSAVAYCEGYIFNNCSSLIYISIPASLTALSGQMFGNTVSMEEYVLPNTLTSIGPYTFYYCQSLQSISVPANVSSIGNYAFGYSGLLDEIHILSTTPASLGTDPFKNIASNYVIYVPVGTLSTYQTAWSTYADHILEEGQTPNRMMLAKFKEETDEPQDDMR